MDPNAKCKDRCICHCRNRKAIVGSLEESMHEAPPLDGVELMGNEHQPCCHISTQGTVGCFDLDLLAILAW